MEGSLSALLDHLHDESPDRPEEWRGWRITPAAETVSGLTYRVNRVEGASEPLGVKFATRDHSDRASTEYGCLSALQAADLDVAPEPVLLEKERYSRPVIVSTWLQGQIVQSIPQDEQSWKAILEHLLTVHSLTRETVSRDTAASVPTAALTAHSAREGLTRLQEHLTRELPPLSSGEAPAEIFSLWNLVEKIEHTEYSSWPLPQSTLCRGDLNRYNFLLRQDESDINCLSFDWEHSGWGDPAFEVAGLVSAPTMVKMPQARKEWLISQYAANSTDETIATRIRTYQPLVFVWWAIRFARFLAETPPEDEEHRLSAQASYERYSGMAESALQRIS